MEMTTKQIIRQLTNIEKMYKPVTPLVIKEAKELAVKYQQLQADYETRLKADMVAMLTDLSMKIGEIEDGYTEFDEENKRSLTMIPLESVERLIDREINSLKGEGEK